MGAWILSAGGGRCGADRLHSDQLQPEVTYPIEQAEEMRLVPDLADQHGEVWSWLQDHAVEGGGEPVGQPAAQGDPVVGRVHGQRPSSPPSAPARTGLVFSASVMAQAALTRPMWLNAWG